MCCLVAVLQYDWLLVSNSGDAHCAVLGENQPQDWLISQGAWDMFCACSVF
jgi:hypothetical protein